MCRTVDDVLAAADADSAGDEPLSQATTDLVAAILAPYDFGGAHRIPDQVSAAAGVTGCPVDHARTR